MIKASAKKKKQDRKIQYVRCLLFQMDFQQTLQKQKYSKCMEF